MAYELEIKVEPLRALRAMPPQVRREIGHRLHRPAQDFSGDVTKLRGSKNEYRLRVGSKRALFELVGNKIIVYAVGDRKEIYQ